MRSLLTVIGVLAGIIIILGILALFLYKYTEHQKELDNQRRKEVPVFLHQIIDSVRDDTNFYKENSTERAWDTEELKMYADKLTGPNDIVIIDCDWGYDFSLYECKIKFGKAEFKAEVLYKNNSPKLSYFSYERPKW